MAGLLFLGLSSPAGPLVSAGDPASFFTNVATRLLQSELGVDLNRIQVFPGNQYTPAVHRLLQFTANLYDATTNRSFNVPSATNGYPTVFRPIFLTTNESGADCVYIVGYTNLEDASIVLNPPPIHDLSSTNSANFPVEPYDMVCGIPLIIGARKGFPNFNEFEMVTGVQVTRKLEFIRTNLKDSKPFPDETNVMYVVGISNTFGVEAWNSYSNPYPRNLELVCSATISAFLTNEVGKVLLLSTASPANPTGAFFGSNVWSTVGPWPGYTEPTAGSYAMTFKLPWGLTNWWHLPTAQFWQGTGPSDEFFKPIGQVDVPFEKHPATAFHVPHWYLNLRTRLQFALVDTAVSPPRIVDYVNLASSDTPVDISYNLTLNNDYITVYPATSATYFADGSPGGMWATNRYQDVNSEAVPTFGVVNQIGASLARPGVGPFANLDWSYASDAPKEADRLGEINFFRTNFAKTAAWPGVFQALFLTNRFFAPFSPTRSIYIYTSWQANDPLVHYTLGDLLNPQVRRRVTVNTNYHGVTIANLRQLNVRYEPWNRGWSPNPYTKINPAVKDPLVTCSDDWDFPGDLLLDLTGLGRVHRGTPWQSVYLKCPIIDNLSAWQQWTGNPDPHDAQSMLPTNDWHLASQLLPLLNTNDLRSLLSPNQPTLQDWCGALDNILVLTNILSEIDLINSPFRLPQFEALIMSSNAPQAASIAAAVNTMRVRQPGQYFRQPGDILATPELSMASPWLTRGPQILVYGITDQAYEAIPAQLLPRLRPDSIGSAVSTAGNLQIQFTGLEGYAYAVQTSSNLLDWVRVSTHYPTNGVFRFLDTPSPADSARYYRSVMLP